MQQERPFLREDSERVVKELRAAFGSAEPHVTADLPGTVFRLERVSPEELKVVEPADASSTRVFLGAADRPAGYPDDLPYLAEEILMLSHRADTSTGVWWSMRDPEQILNAVADQCLASGWVQEAADVSERAGIMKHTFHRSGVVRHLIVGPGLVSLVQQPLKGRPGL